LAYCDKVCYLGVVFKAGVHMGYDFTNTSMAFYRSFNKLLSKCSFASSELISVFLLQKICIPILTYAFEIINVPVSYINRLDNLINNAIRRIFNISAAENILYIRHVFGIPNVESTRKKRASKFLLKFSEKNLSYGATVFRLAVCSERWSHDL